MAHKLSVRERALVTLGLCAFALDRPNMVEVGDETGDARTYDDAD